HRKFNILKWKKGDKCVIEIPYIHIPEFQVEIPDSDECEIIIRKNLDKLREKLDRVKEKLHEKPKLIKEYVYI
ncbi:MAG: hypothetical protein KAT17_06525, partial [Candidatus Aminicenantes bacterium]|nr:hypothetical protein [Candidatus Aminicenantes bacterium]